MCDSLHILQLEVIKIYKWSHFESAEVGVNSLPLRNFQTGTGKNLPPFPLSPGDPGSENTGSDSGSRLRLFAVLSHARIIKMIQTQAISRRLGAHDMVRSGPLRFSPRQSRRRRARVYKYWEHLDPAADWIITTGSWNATLTGGNVQEIFKIRSYFTALDFICFTSHHVCKTEYNINIGLFFVFTFPYLFCTFHTLFIP